MLRDCEPNELERIIQEYPLTQESVREIMGDKIGVIKPTHLLKKSAMDYSKKSGKYNLKFSEKELEESAEVQAEIFIHMIYHIHCGISSIMHNEVTLKKSLNMERIFDIASHAFYKENKEFVDCLYKEVYSRYLKQKMK